MSSIQEAILNLKKVIESKGARTRVVSLELNSDALKALSRELKELGVYSEIRGIVSLYGIKISRPERKFKSVKRLTKQIPNSDSYMYPDYGDDEDWKYSMHPLWDFGDRD